MSKRIQLFCTDLDGTIYGNDAASKRFGQFWQSAPLNHRPRLCYNSGRLVADQLELIAAGKLLRPDFLIGGVGTEIFEMAGSRFLTQLNESWLASGWDVRAVEFILNRKHGIQQQPESFQTTFKSSWFWPNLTPAHLDSIRKEFNNAGLRVSIVYSSKRDLDVLPAGADKGAALRWLCNHLQISMSSVVVAGDSANDAALFELRNVRGILVSNHHEELSRGALARSVFRASNAEADGVIEGLRHFLYWNQNARSYGNIPSNHSRADRGDTKPLP